MKRLLFLLLLFVNLQVITKHGDFVIRAGVDAVAQHMYQEAGDNCYDSEIGWYHSSYSTCEGVPIVGNNSKSGSGGSTYGTANINSFDTSTYSGSDNGGQDSSQSHSNSTPNNSGSTTGGVSFSIINGDESTSTNNEIVVNTKPLGKITVPIPKRVVIGSLGALIADLAYSVNDIQEFNDKLNNIYNEKNGGYILSKKMIEELGIVTNDNSTGFQCTLLEKTEDGVTTYVMAFAGTDPTSINDLIEDVAQLTGLSSQYNQALVNAYNLVNKVGSANVTFVGHSLGGGMATAASMATSAWGVTYNPACLSRQSLEDLHYTWGQADPIHVLNYISSYDQIKKLQDFAGMTYQGHTQVVPASPDAPADHFLNNMISSLQYYGY